LLAAVATPDSGWDERFTTRWWGLEEGLPQISVNAILHGRDGFLWVGTFGGLVRFDGLSFQMVPSRSGQVPAFPRVLCLEEGPSGRLWVGMEAGGLAEVRHGELVAPADLPSLGDTTVFGISEEPGGALWVTAMGRGLSRLTPTSVTTWGEGEGLGGGQPIKVLALPGGGALVNVGYRLMEAQEGASLRPLSLPASISDFNLDVDGSVLASSLDGALYRLRGGGKETLKPPLRETGFASSFFARDSGGRTWAIVRRRGLFLVEGKGVRPVNCPGVAGRAFNCFAADREGGLWLGTQDAGLVQVSLASFRVLSRADGLPGEVVRPVVEAHDGSIWAAVSCNVLVRWNGSALTRLELPNRAGFDGCVYSLLVRRDGTLLASGYSQGVVRIANGRLTGYPRPAPRFPTALLEDRRGHLWVGTRFAGVSRIEGPSPRDFRASDGLPSDQVATLMEDEDGRLLVGTAAGVGVIDGDRVVPLATTGDPMLPAVRALLREGPHLWLGSYGAGLGLVENGRLFRFTTAHGLPEGVASYLHRDRHGYLWWTGNRGIYRARVSALVDAARGVARRVPVQRFGTADGLLSAETNGGFLPAGCAARDGRLYVPTVQGLAIVDPARLAQQPSAPTPLLDRVVVDGQPATPEGGTLTVPGSTRRVEFRFSAPTFHAPQAVRFLKRLEGFDPDWVEGDGDSHATFTGLPPGRYILAVRTVNHTGIVGPPHQLLTLVVQARLTQRLSFRLGVVGVLLALVAATVGGRVVALRHRNLLLARLVRQRTRELETANRQLARQAHIDALTGLYNRGAFTAQLVEHMELAVRHERALAVVMMDVDHFKAYNDALGHVAGDTCLRRLGSQLLACLYQPSDVAARLGGEEFALLLSGANLAHAAAVAKRVCASIERLAIPHPTSPVAPVVTVSCGYASLADLPEPNGDALLRAADEALYRAKSAGRNRVSG